MLKIKDNVDLKELEKFGFSLDDYGVSYEKNIHKDSNLRFSARLKVIPNRLLLIDIYNDNEILYTDGFNLDIVYDLIKADLVEKVEELK